MKWASTVITLLVLVSTVQSLSATCSALLQVLSSSPSQSIASLEKASCLTNLTPRYKWSQNMSHIQVKIQFPVSSETTTCQQLLHQDRQANASGFTVRVLCLHSRQLLVLYSLQVVTFKSLDYQWAVWSRGAQNSVILECPKSPAPYFWPLLHSRQRPPRHKPKVWWELLAKYGKQMLPVLDLLEIGDQDRDISVVVRAKKNKKSKTDQNEHVDFGCNKGSPEFIGSWL